MAFLFIIIILFFHLFLGIMLISNAISGRYSRILKNDTLAIVMFFALLLTIYLTFLWMSESIEVLVGIMLALLFSYGMAWRVYLKDDEQSSLTFRILQGLAGAVFNILSIANALFFILIILYFGV